MPHRYVCGEETNLSVALLLTVILVHVQAETLNFDRYQINDEYFACNKVDRTGVGA